MRDPLFAGQTSFKTYNDDNGQPGLRTAEVVRDRGQVFCYMQLLTFWSKKLTPAESKDPKVGQPFLTPIQKFVASCEAKHLPLILDLKFNGGGFSIILRNCSPVLTEKDKTYPGKLLAFRVTSSMVDLLTNDLDPKDSARVI